MIRLCLILIPTFSYTPITMILANRSKSIVIANTIYLIIGILSVSYAFLARNGHYIKNFEAVIIIMSLRLSIRLVDLEKSI